MIKNIHMVILMEHDFEAAVNFYKKLGLPLQFQLEGAWAEFELGNIKIGLCPTKIEQSERKTGIVFELDDLKQFYNEHKDNLAFIGEPVEKVHGIMLSLKDPSGNIIDLYEPTPEKVTQLVQDVATHGKKNCCSGNDTCTCHVNGREKL